MKLDAKMASDPMHATMRIRCPICKRELENIAPDFAFRPFCSQRCKTIDLGNWLGEAYRFSRAVHPDERDDEIAQD